MQNIVDQWSFYPYAESNVDFGLCVLDATNGVGLATRGLIWEAYDIYFDISAASGISTAWALSFAGASTSWTDSFTGASTSWSDVRGGIWGEFPE